MATTTNNHVISLKSTSKIFRDFWLRPRVKAVNTISFDLQQGEVFGLLGPNGSGKSTTVKMILGLLRPTSGHIQVLGQAPHTVQPKGQIGYLPEESYLYAYLTAEETLDFYGRLFGLDHTTRKERVEQLLTMVGLQAARNRCVGEFSKGMARRIGLAQALINDPDLIILDEPTSGLDPIGCRQVKDLIKALAERGKTVLLSSHLLADVEDICDRIAILYNGHIKALGTMESILTKEDAIQITLPCLDKTQTEKLLARLRDIMSGTPDIQHPHRTLEAVFLETVEQATREHTSPTGALPTYHLADFLSTTHAKTLSQSDE